MKWLVSRLSRKHPSPADIASGLATAFLSGDDSKLESLLDLSDVRKLRFREHMRLYRTALVLLAVLAECERNSRFQRVRIEFERLIFPPSPDEGMPLVRQLRQAMVRLGELVRGTDEQALAWAKAWFEEANIGPTNLAAELELALLWKISYVGITDAVRSLGAM